MIEIELVRLCSLWDPPEQDAFTVPTVVALINNPVVINLMAQEIADYWRDLQRDPVNIGSFDAEQISLIKQAYERASEKDVKTQYEKTTVRALNSIRLAALTEPSPTLANVRNFRNKHIAYATAMTRIERKSGPLPPPKVGDEQRLLRLSLRVLKRLDLCVRGADFDWKNSERIARQNAEALWHGVSINVLR